MFINAGVKNRFNLLLLGENEHYFTDYSAIFYPISRTDQESIDRYLISFILLILFIC